MNTWNVRDARANLAALLSAAREGNPQTVRQSGTPDVVMTRASAAVTALPTPAYLLAALAQRDAMAIVLAQYKQRQNGGSAAARQSFADMHLPPNLSGDVVRWARAERGAFAAAEYVVAATRAMRAMQQQLDLPLSTVAQVVDGLELASGEPPLFDDECRRWITELATLTWDAEAPAALGRWDAAPGSAGAQ